MTGSFSTRTFQKVHGTGRGTAGIDDDFAARGFGGLGAWILGRNMFGPIRGPWPDEAWKGLVGRQRVERTYRRAEWLATARGRAPRVVASCAPGDDRETSSP